MDSLKPNTLHVDNLSPRNRTPSSGLSSVCSSGSISPVPIIPIIAISRDGDESESESDIETEPARIFQRRMSTKRNNNLVSTSISPPATRHFWRVDFYLLWRCSRACQKQKFLERKLYAFHVNALWRVYGCISFVIVR